MESVNICWPSVCTGLTILAGAQKVSLSLSHDTNCVSDYKMVRAKQNVVCGSVLVQFAHYVFYKTSLTSVLCRAQNLSELKSGREASSLISLCKLPQPLLFKHSRQPSARLATRQTRSPVRAPFDQKHSSCLRQSQHPGHRTVLRWVEFCCFGPSGPSLWRPHQRLHQSG